MSEYQFNFTGWKAVAAGLVLLGILGVRLMTFNDKRGDTTLMQKLDLLLTMDYFPDDVENLKSVLKTGDTDAVAKTVKSITTSKISIESVQTSYPLFDLKNRKEVVVKVTYSLDDAFGNRKRKTKYYLFDHGSIGNMWSYRYGSSALSYYLNFL